VLDCAVIYSLVSIGPDGNVSPESYKYQRMSLFIVRYRHQNTILDVPFGRMRPAVLSLCSLVFVFCFHSHFSLNFVVSSRMHDAVAVFGREFRYQNSNDILFCVVCYFRIYTYKGQRYC